MADENNNDELPPQPKPLPPEMMSDPESETVGHMVREYLWGKGPIDYPVVSAHLNKGLVSRFVEIEMRDLPPQFFWRVRVLADLYNLKEHLDFIQSFLQKQESKPTELDRSIASTIILEEIGDDQKKQFAAQYYEYLVSHRLANLKFAELIKCLAALGRRARPNSLRSRMEQEMKTLAAREAADPAAGVNRRSIEDLFLNEFFFISEANQSRDRISAIEGKDARLRELIRAYLELTDDAGADYFALWTQQQIRRQAESDGKETVIEVFRSTANSLTKAEAEDEIFCKVRCYNAIEFFLGELTADEDSFMKKHRQQQVDPLRYMPVPLHVDEKEEETEVIAEDEETVPDNEQ